AWSPAPPLGSEPATLRTTGRVIQPWDGSNSSESELMQKRSPVGGGPSGKTWPRCPSHVAQRTSTRTMPWERSSRRFTSDSSTASQNLGQPRPESYLVDESKSAVLQPAQR